MSPCLQSPLALGADIVMHSTTKFLNGHSDGLGGALIGTTPEHKEHFWLVQKAAGGIMSPFERFLVLRGIKHPAPAHEAARGERPRGGRVPVDADQRSRASPIPA